jgi:hypothetical protein
MVSSFSTDLPPRLQLLATPFFNTTLVLLHCCILYTTIQRIFHATSTLAMAPRTRFENDGVSADDVFISTDSGYDTDVSFFTDTSIDENFSEHCADLNNAQVTDRSNAQATLSAVTAAHTRVQQITAERQLTSIRSTAASLVTTPNRTADVEVSLYQRLLNDIRCTLNRPEITVEQQRILCTLMDAVTGLLEDLRCHVPLARIVSQRNGLPVYGPQRRPLSRAAIIQNAQARTRRAYISALAARGIVFPVHQGFSERPIRYSETYDDLLRWRSLDDGTVGASALRNGEDETLASRFNWYYHNGLSRRRDHLCITTDDRQLVEVQQARLLAGLPVEELNEEISSRVESSPGEWGWLGCGVDRKFGDGTKIW